MLDTVLTSEYTHVSRSDLLEIRLAISEEGRSQNAVVALEAQIELQRRDLQVLAQRRAAVGAQINEKYALGTGDTYNQITGEIKRVDSVVACPGAPVALHPDDPRLK